MNDVNSASSDSLSRATRNWRRGASLAARTRLKPAAAVVLGAAIAALVWLYLAHQGSAEGEAQAKPAAQVETVPLQRQAIAQTLEAFGVVEAAPAADRTTPATYESVVVAIHAVPGAHVNAGDVVMEIAPSPDAKLQYESARTTLKLAEQSLAAVQERYDLKLATSQDLITAQQAERDARQKLTSYEARGMGGDGKLRAPVMGVVSKLDVTAGSLVASGSPLFAIATDKHLEARLSVESATVAQLAAGQSVTLQSMSRPEAVTVTSTVRVVGGTVNATTGSADVRVPVPAPAPLLLGEHVRAIIEVEKKDSALVVPRSAVLPDADQQVLFTVKDGKSVRHEVNLGIAAGERVEVQAPDLHPGDAVVTLGNYELTDGMAIQAPEPAATQPKAAEPDAGKSAQGETP